jgi:hypothetical protein
MIYILLLLLLFSTILNIFLVISLKKAFNQIDLLESWLVDFKSLVKNTYNKLKSVDDRGIFVKDDDVGVLFTDLLTIIEITNTRIQSDDNYKSSDFNEKNKNEIL